MSENGSEKSEASRPLPIWESVSMHFDEILKEYLPVTGVDPQKVKRVASIGCGTFYEAALLTEKFTNAQVIGYERDPFYIGAAKKIPSFPQGVEIKEVDLAGDDTDLDGVFEVLIIRNPDIHRTENWKKVIGKCIRKLDPKGVIILTNNDQPEGKATLPLLVGLDIKVSEPNKNDWPEDAIMKTTDNYVIVAQKP